jgi:acetyl-CoA acetyltransferase
MASSDDIALIGWSISPMVRSTDKTEAQMLLEVITGAVEDAGITRREVDFTCAGSCDYVAGQAFSFVQNIDAIGAWPPKRDSHVEMDGAWAMYEAWIRLQLGDIDVAVAMGSGRSSTANPALIYPMEMDPYYLAPLWPDSEPGWPGRTAHWTGTGCSGAVPTADGTSPYGSRSAPACPQRFTGWCLPPAPLSAWGRLTSVAGRSAQY